MTVTDHPTEAYLPALIAGQAEALAALFAGAPRLDDPLAGHVVGAADFQRFVTERHAWLAERGARAEPQRTTRQGARTVAESLLHLRLPSGFISLPVAVVGEHDAAHRLTAVRVYHSLWPLFGEHRVRPALLPPDPERRLSGAVADYQRALASGDVEAILSTFESDGYFREPAGAAYRHAGLERLREFMTQILAAGGITLEHCTVTDDGTACALEFNAVAFGPHALVPQAGVAVYERGATGRLYGARIYDDVNVEAYAG